MFYGLINELSLPYSDSEGNVQTSTVTTYTYDANGNLIKKKEGTKSTTYAFDVWGNMTSGAGASYTYNAQGLRTSKTVNKKKTNFTLINGKVWSDGTYNYVWGAELITNGSVYYLYNAHGDVVQLLNSSGTVTKTYDYEAYGNELKRDAADTNPFRYCGEYYDTETGFIYLRARYYDPSVGRFISQDPVKDGLNWYAYCNNSPLAYIDPSGLSAESENDDIVYRSSKAWFYNAYFKFQNFLSGKASKKQMKRALKNYEFNSTTKLETECESVGYYNGQNILCGNFLIGKSTVEESGCEALAVYNALYNLGYHDIKLSEIIFSIEKNDALMKAGKWGANPYSLGRTLDEYGVSMDEISLQDALKQGTYIFSYITEGDKEVHTVAAYYNKETGIFYVYNDRPSFLGVTKYNSIKELAPDYICGFYLT